MVARGALLALAGSDADDGGRGLSSPSRATPPATLLTMVEPRSRIQGFEVLGFGLSTATLQTWQSLVERKHIECPPNPFL